MKRITAIFFLSAYMFSFAEFHNLLKIPVLFQHFKEHRQADQGISFFSFIKIHYLDPIVMDDDYQRDQQLPFRDADCCLFTTSSVCECTNMVVDVSRPDETVPEFHVFDEINKPQFIPFKIFQPPRCA